MTNPQITASNARAKVLSQVCAGFAGSLTFLPWGSILMMYRDFMENLRNLRKPAQGVGARTVCALGVRTTAVMGQNQVNVQDSADSARCYALHTYGKATAL